MNQVRLFDIGEQTDYVLFLVYKNRLAMGRGEYLTIKLGEKLAVLTRPNSNRAVLATCENVVSIRVNGGYGATVSVIDFP